MTTMEAAAEATPFWRVKKPTERMAKPFFGVNRANRRARNPKHTRYSLDGQVTGHTTQTPRDLRRHRNARRSFLAKAARRRNR